MASPGQFYGYDSNDADAAANQAALQRAKANCRKHNKGEHRCTFTIPLNVRICAGMIIKLEGWGPEWDRNYKVVCAHHTLGKGRGSETTMELEACLGY